MGPKRARLARRASWNRRNRVGSALNRLDSCSQTVNLVAGDRGARIGRKGSYESWCPGRDLNPDELPHTPLKRTRIPIPPPGQVCSQQLTGSEERWYRGRDLNPYALAGTSS